LNECNIKIIVINYYILFLKILKNKIMVNKLFTLTNISIYIIIVILSCLLLSSTDIFQISDIIPF